MKIKKEDMYHDFESEIVERQIQLEIETVLTKGSKISAILGLLSGTLILIFSLIGLMKNVVLPGIMAAFGGAWSLLMYFITKSKKLKGWVIYAIFIPLINIPTILFLLSHYFTESGAAAYITGPFSFLYFFLIVLTGFIFNKRLTKHSGYVTGFAYFLIFIMALPKIRQIAYAPPLLYQDLTNYAINGFKSMMLVFVGLAVAALSEHVRTLIFRIIKEVKEKESINKLFGQYVSSEVRDKIIIEKSSIKGESKNVTILFSDIISFTSFSENKKPIEIVEMLNEYFEKMVKCIENNGGVVDKFIGDAIMAVFGGLVELDNSCDSAIKAAMDMQDVIKLLNENWEKKGILGFQSGIGLHFGEVLQGSIGSESRKDFTIIGDPVNAASRIESLTRKYEKTIILSESVYLRLSDDLKIRCKDIDTVNVKGKKEAIKIYAVE